MKFLFSLAISLCRSAPEYFVAIVLTLLLQRTMIEPVPIILIIIIIIVYTRFKPKNSILLPYEYYYS